MTLVALGYYKDDVWETTKILHWNAFPHLVAEPIYSAEVAGIESLMLILAHASGGGSHANPKRQGARA